MPAWVDPRRCEEQPKSRPERRGERVELGRLKRHAPWRMKRGVHGSLFKEVHYSLDNLIGDIGLPDIQHPFGWSNANVRDLFDSLWSWT